MEFQLWLAGTSGRIICDNDIAPVLLQLAMFDYNVFYGSTNPTAAMLLFIAFEVSRPIGAVHSTACRQT